MGGKKVGLHPKIGRVAGIVLVVLLAMPFPGAAGPGEAATGSAARAALHKAVEHFQRGQYETAAEFLIQAQSGHRQLTAAEDKELDSWIGLNNLALRCRYDGAQSLRTAEAALSQGQIAEAHALLQWVSGNPYLSPRDSQVLTRLMRESGMIAGPRPLFSVLGNFPGESGRLLLGARSALQRGQLVAAEELARQADKADNRLVRLPWSDSPAKVLRDVQAARLKQAAQPASPELAKLPSAKSDRAIQSCRLVAEVSAPPTSRESSHVPAAAPPGPGPGMAAAAASLQRVSAATAAAPPHLVDPPANELSLLDPVVRKNAVPLPSNFLWRAEVQHTDGLAAAGSTLASPPPQVEENPVGGREDVPTTGSEKKSADTSTAVDSQQFRGSIPPVEGEKASPEGPALAAVAEFHPGDIRVPPCSTKEPAPDVRHEAVPPLLATAVAGPTAASPTRREKENTVNSRRQAIEAAAAPCPAKEARAATAEPVGAKADKAMAPNKMQNPSETVTPDPAGHAGRTYKFPWSRVGLAIAVILAFGFCCAWRSLGKEEEQ